MLSRRELCNGVVFSILIRDKGSFFKKACGVFMCRITERVFRLLLPDIQRHRNRIPHKDHSLLGLFRLEGLLPPVDILPYIVHNRCKHLCLYEVSLKHHPQTVSVMNCIIEPPRFPGITDEMHFFRRPEGTVTPISFRLK
jgi:hypothetical protein